MATLEPGWTRIETEAAFRQAFVDKPLVSEDLKFIFHADGRISGSVGESLLTGTWDWRGAFFCRTAELDGEPLGLDCEIIERRGRQMRYTRDKGAGEASVAVIE